MSSKNNGGKNLLAEVRRALSILCLKPRAERAGASPREKREERDEDEDGSLSLLFLALLFLFAASICPSSLLALPGPLLLLKPHHRPGARPRECSRCRKNKRMENARAVWLRFFNGATSREKEKQSRQEEEPKKLNLDHLSSPSFPPSLQHHTSSSSSRPPSPARPSSSSGPSARSTPTPTRRKRQSTRRKKSRGGSGSSRGRSRPTPTRTSSRSRSSRTTTSTCRASATWEGSKA